jgi:hypothetical protein
MAFNYAREVKLKVIVAVADPHRLLIAKSDIQKARDRRQKLINSALELLTNPETAPMPEKCYHWLFVASTFGSKKLLDAVIAGTEEKPDLREELLAGLLYDIMRRLVE